MGKIDSDVAIRRKADGVFLYTANGGLGGARVSPTPKYLSTEQRARMSVRIDMGIPIDEVEFITREALTREAPHE